MTLSARNNFFRGGIIFAAVSLIIAAAGGYFAFSFFPETAGAAGPRSQGIMQLVAVRLAAPSAYVPYWTLLGTVTCSLIGIVLIYYFFENTQSPEILFFGLFIISLSFEFIRIVLPLKMAFPFPAMYLIAIFRALFFGRYFGMFSLFAAGVYAAGMDMQKQQNIFLMLVLASLYISLNVPIDILVWDSTFLLWNGYNSMLKVAETGIMVITIITFFVSSINKGSKNYITIGIGVLMAFSGRNILFNSDSWITLFPGFFLLLAGAWFVCTRLHREYLWL